MFQNYKKVFMLLFCGTLAQVASSQDLLHYWHFNALPSGTIENSVVADVSALNRFATSITYPGSGAGYVDNVAGDVLNAQPGVQAGLGLRPRNPSNTRNLLVSFPTTGYENIEIKFATTRTTQGASEQTYAYSLDGGETFITTDLPVTSHSPDSEAYGLVTLDFSNIAGVNNNSNVVVRISFGGTTAAGTSGNNRFDNLTITGNVIGGEDTTAPVATITPANNTANVAVNTALTVAFNEDVRLINDDAITNANAASLVQLRVGDAQGATVAATATFANNTITVTPAAALANNEQYYVALLANSVEDSSNNAIATTTASTFSTIAVQTQFAAGDLAFIGYRMNASGTEDEIALVTFVDIAPGTMINFTDAKYTTNAQAQCAGGFTWTADSCLAAGSVITIQTDSLITNTGSAAGSGFGLSSGGDQVIVYAGTAAAPNYITALTSNGWITENTTCNGSNSMLPAGLTDLVTASNLSTATGNASGNTVNGFYNGEQTGTPAELKVAILNPANWTGIEGSTAAQVWPAWAFPSSPSVQSATVVSNTSIALVFNNELDAAAAALANFAGIAGLTTATIEGNIVTLTYQSGFTSGTAYELTVSNIEDEAGLTMACPYVFSFNYNTTVSLADDFIVVNEDAGTLNFVVNVVNPGAGSVDLVLKAAPFSTANAEDFTFTTQTITLTGTSSTTQSIAIPIIDDAVAEQQAEYFVLSLENAVDVTIEGETLATIYIKDNDVQAPVPSRSIALEFVRSFDPSGDNNSTCEIVAYDPVSKKLFATSAVEDRLDIVDFTNPEVPVTLSSIDMSSYGGVTSVAVKNGLVAVASPNANEQLNGSVVFFNTNGEFISQVTVGALPDNISFTPDGTKVLTANEGQPNADYSVDPEGSVSIIDITGGATALTNANVTTLGFEAYNGTAAEAALRASGVRKLKLTSTMSQDFEPEYITTSADSQKAWVALQENNAIAEINLSNNTITDVWALGTKDMSLPGNGFDISDNNGEVLIANWPIHTYFIPDGVASYTVNGTNYIVTANEGDEKEYGSFVERTTIGAGSYNLNDALFPQAAMLKKSYNAGRMRVSNLEGLNTDGTAYDKIYALGSRSFSIFNADTKAIVFDSGDDFEMYTSTEPSISALFNADSEDNTAKGRSRAKGPEPEGVTVAHIEDKVFAFVGLERIGGVMVYDITNPNDAQFVDYANTRTVSAYGGDNGPEGILYINGTDSPNATPYVIVANEISGTLSIFEVNTEALGVNKPSLEPKTFVVFPNPSVQGIVYFNRVADIEVYDYSGKLIQAAKEALTIDTSKMASGIYIVKTSEGIVKKLIIK